MESLKSKKDIESEALMKLTEMLNRLIDEGAITKEDLEDENFIQKIVDIYIESESQKKKGDVK